MCDHDEALAQLRADRKLTQLLASQEAERASAPLQSIRVVSHRPIFDGCFCRAALDGELCAQQSIRVRRVFCARPAMDRSTTNASIIEVWDRAVQLAVRCGVESGGRLAAERARHGRHGSLNTLSSGWAAPRRRRAAVGCRER